MTPAPTNLDVTLEGAYAGAVSRLVAFVVDSLASAFLFVVGLAAISYAAQLVIRRPIAWHRHELVWGVALGVWELAYFAVSWAIWAQTLGMGLFGIKVVRADGSPLSIRRALIRALVFPLSFVACGLGLLPILFQREHRALHDFIAGTAVVYAWDARAAQLRLLARARERELELSSKA